MSIEVICGPMFSGKSEELIRRLTRASYANQTTLACKPSLDNRFGIDTIRSHSGFEQACQPLKDIEEIYSKLVNRVDLIAVEEAQFFDPKSFRKFLTKMNPSKTKIIIAGLDMDFQGEPFENITYGMGIAVKVEKLTAVCVECSADATMTYKKQINSKRVEIGAADMYEARCYDCWCRGYQLQRTQSGEAFEI